MVSKKVEVKSEREIKTYAEFLHTSFCLLEIAKKHEEGSYHLIMSSLVFTAFTLEAFLNHIGPQVFNCWSDLERLSPKEKLNVIAEKIELKIDYGIQPWQIMKDLFLFRNDIAHGKNAQLSQIKTQSLEEHNKYFQTIEHIEKTRWEKYCTKSNAEKARENVKEIVKSLLVAAKIEEYPFSFGFSHVSSTLLPD